MMVQPIWWEYALFDDDGLIGIKPEAPDEMKKAYDEYVREQEEAKAKGSKL